MQIRNCPDVVIRFQICIFDILNTADMNGSPVDVEL